MYQNFTAAELQTGQGKRAHLGKYDVNFEDFLLALHTGSWYTNEEVKEIPSGFRQRTPVPKGEFSRERERERHRRFMKALASCNFFGSEEPKTEKPSLWRQLYQWGIQLLAQLRKLCTRESKP